MNASTFLFDELGRFFFFFVIFPSFLSVFITFFFHYFVSCFLSLLSMSSFLLFEISSLPPFLPSFLLFFSLSLFLPSYFDVLMSPNSLSSLLLFFSFLFHPCLLFTPASPLFPPHCSSLSHLSLSYHLLSLVSFLQMT